MHDVVPLGERGYQATPRVPFRGLPGLSLAVHLCRDGDVSLAALFRRVPEDYLAAVSVLASRWPAWSVACPCGALVVVGPELEPCPGSCGRWMVADLATGAWSARLPEQDPDEL